MQHTDFQYWISLLGSNIHPWHIFAGKGPSVTLQQIFEFVVFTLSHQSPWHFKRMQFKWNFLCTLWLNKGLVPIHYKYFVRNLTLHHFLLGPEAWNPNMHISINLTSYTSSKLADHAYIMQYSRTLLSILLRLLHHHMYAIVPVRHLQAWMFHASRIILYTLQIVCYFNLKILFNK